MSKVIGIGNALVDIMTRLQNDDVLKEFSLPKGSMQLISRELSNRILASTVGLPKLQSSGGSAANTIHGLANLGIRTGFVGKIGTDNMGRFFKKDLKESNINPLIFNDLEETGRSIALISPDSERTMATYLGAAVGLHEEDISSDLYRGYDYLYVEGYLVQNRQLITKAFRLAREHGLKTALDTASYNIVEENRDFFLSLTADHVDILFANEAEAQSLTGREPEEALHELAGLAEIAVVKLGSQGSIIKSGKEVHRAGIIDVKSIDTTGAGDLYASGFMYGLCSGLDLQQCAEAGAVLGGLVTSVVGAKLGKEEWEQAWGMIGEIKAAG